MGLPYGPMGVLRDGSEVPSPVPWDLGGSPMGL
jgi:hypothetical protein